MIRFKCIYCGQIVLAPDDGTSKKGKCPHCQHTLVVPKTTKGRPAVSADNEPIPERPKSRISDGDKDLRFGAVSGFGGQEDAAIELYKESFGFLIPTYDKLSLFLMTVTLILLFMINTELRDLKRDWIRRFGTDWDCVQTLVYTLIFICIIVFLYMLFTFGEETGLKKIFMLAFAVLANIAGGFFAGVYVIRNTAEFTWLLVFPVWNIINSVLLLLMLQYKFIDEECISDRKATFFQIILGLLAVCVILILCNYVFKLYWAITWSICVVYTTSFDRALQNIFPGLENRGDEQAD